MTTSCSIRRVDWGNDHDQAQAEIRECLLLEQRKLHTLESEKKELQR